MTTTAPHRLGEIRPSQLIFTYGVGALIDLPRLSVIVRGLDDWNMVAGGADRITEERLLRAVQSQLSEVKELRAPPYDPNDKPFLNPFSGATRVGVPVALFPRWLFCPRCQLLAPVESGLFTFKPNQYRPDRTCYVHESCPRAREPQVSPARFVVACPNGHLDDFPWIEFTHDGVTNCRALLRLFEVGPGGEARDLLVRCDTCGASRVLAEAFGKDGTQKLPRCRGRRPHLGDFDPDPCNGQLKTMLLGTSNLWFSDVVTTLALPVQGVSSQLAQMVADHWGDLYPIPDQPTFALMRNMSTNPFARLTGFRDDEVWQAVEERRAQLANGLPNTFNDVKQPEWELFTGASTVPNSNDFQIRLGTVPQTVAHLIERVVLVERLREVRALIGFTRVDPPGDSDDSRDAASDKRAPLSRQSPTWVPAAEVRGEGIFLQFREDAITAWLQQPAVKERATAFLRAHTTWRTARGITPPDADFPGMRYVLLHSFAHALMRQFVLECGYTAASIRERLYVRNANEPGAPPEPMAGILIYTAAPDSEGTLGGLVSLGEKGELQRHLAAMLADGELCASDPLCAEHAPSTDGITLHAAACHACLFAPETSCERGNKYLDRSVLVPTVEQADLAFFAETLERGDTD